MKRASSVVVSVAVSLVLAAACKSNNIESTTNQTLGSQCGTGNGCANNLVCTLGYCREPCTTNADCPSTSACLVGSSGNGNGCRLSSENDCPSTPCTSGLVCSSGGTCGRRWGHERPR
jgi:hypothetical protein